MELLRGIPKTDEILKHTEWKRISGLYPETVMKDALREVLNGLREGIKQGYVQGIPPLEEIIDRTEEKAKRFIKPGLTRVINGTGVIIHTNMGRSLLPKYAIEAVIQRASHFCNLEYDLDKGSRGDRYVHSVSVLQRLTGCESALIVNNNAAAVYLILNTLAEGREVVISRGELVEIGGSFRIPDVMKKSGAILKEVGTTNRTYREDYEAAITESTGLLMKVHTSNYRIKGFVYETSSEDIIALAKKYNLPSYFDAGSGLLFPLQGLDSINEPSIIEETKKGWSLISFSGDKLLGGPQAGIIIGEKPYIDAMKKNPMTRAMRPDKFTLAALEAILLTYLEGDRAKEKILTLKMIYEGKERIKARSKRVIKYLEDLGGHGKAFSITLVELESQVGGGSLPDVYLPSYGIAIKPKTITIERLEGILRALEVPIIGRIEKDTLLIDLRTILPEDEPYLIKGLKEAIAKALE
ncbi:MAG: L-seryl-tRNA(Sec) selenium transferase [Syntrophorhabdaceae bacterium]|nr:L-seryl-tRNA(Sec) selenium transferase [Syntrophorhabdaceae bacterium]